MREIIEKIIIIYRKLFSTMLAIYMIKIVQKNGKYYFGLDSRGSINMSFVQAMTPLEHRSDRNSILLLMVLIKLV